MSFVLGVVVGGLVMWRYRDVVGESVSRALSNLERGGSRAANRSGMGDSRMPTAGGGAMGTGVEP